MALLDKVHSIKDIKQKVDLYDKIIKQKLDYDIELLYQLALLDAEMNQDEEDITENHIIDDSDTTAPQGYGLDSPNAPEVTSPDEEDKTQKVLTELFLPNDDLKKDDILKQEPPAVSWDSSVSDKAKFKVVKAKPSAPRRSRAKKGKN